ncbi:MAG TPA: SDR family oxidoreductase [Oligoflexus sp.]|uniref:SDR family oxidoreductase n=1 Tax=Oligoflexus sp. TaxID=1971216 RepID=UPI002D5A2D62|nr:SDR family oxidoreductase [Oligoflexus sp.]HYX32534.1 SDR family oxidoreductase [Oligoflexus sp.]
MILVTGASGNVGSELARILKANGAPFKAAFRDLESADRFGLKNEAVVLDFDQPDTFPKALLGVSRIFLVRPPELADTKRYFLPFIEAARKSGVAHIVFLSVIGADKNKFLPHSKIEQLMRLSGITFTFLRPGFFMQNISGTHAPEIKELADIFVPAGQGRTNFIDVRDIAAAAAVALIEPGHENKAYALTGDEALTYREVAEILSAELGRHIRYSNPSIFRFFHRMRKRGINAPYILVMIVIYSIAKFGGAGTLTVDLRKLIGRPAIKFRDFAQDYRKAWTV